MGVFSRIATMFRDPDAAARLAAPVPAPQIEEEVPAPREVAVVPFGTLETGFARKEAVMGGEGLAPQPAFAHSPFTPTRPILTEGNLIGRRKQLDRAISAIQVERAHLAIFGERGHGKTSFANIFARMAEDSGYGVVRHTCTTQPTFGELFGSVVAKIPARFLRPVMAEEESQSFGRRSVWTVASAVATLEQIRAGHVLIMIDEFDRLSDEDARRDMTELLKTTSDLGVRVSFVLIGVAESLSELLSMHHSLQRALVAIPVPLLGDEDLLELFNKGCRDLRLTLEPSAESALVTLAQGSPYFAQLLSLHASDQASRRGSGELSRADVAAAVKLILEETRHSFEWMLSGMPREDPRWLDLLLAAASSTCDGFGWFTARAVGTRAQEIGLGLPEDPTHGLTILTTHSGGTILRGRNMPGVTEFGFAHTNLRNYVLLRESDRRGAI